MTAMSELHLPADKDQESSGSLLDQTVMISALLCVRQLNLKSKHTVSGNKTMSNSDSYSAEGEEKRLIDSKHE